MTDIYTNNNLGYALSDSELDKIDKVWELINVFNKGIITMRDYRVNVINEIHKSYTVEDFFELERIAEKIYWNMRYKLNENGLTDETIVETKMEDFGLIKKRLKEDNYYRSFINKIVNIDDVNKKIYYKKMEGSAKILAKNNFNLLTHTILFDRNIYERVMNGTIDIKNIVLPEYYFQMDYGFPNLNIVKPFIGSDNFRKQKIEKMYFDEKSESNWFRLIKPKN